MKGCKFTDLQIPSNWISSNNNDGLLSFMTTTWVSAKRYYDELVNCKTGLSFNNPSNYFANNIAKIEFFDILENTVIKTEILKVLEQCYGDITTCSAIEALAVAVLGENVKVSFFLEENPARILFGNVVSFYDAWLTTPDNAVVLEYPDSTGGLIATNVPKSLETTEILRAFFTQFVPPEKYVFFEFES